MVLQGQHPRPRPPWLGDDRFLGFLLRVGKESGDPRQTGAGPETLPTPTPTPTLNLNSLTLLRDGVRKRRGMARDIGEGEKGSGGGEGGGRGQQAAFRKQRVEKYCC